MHKLISMAGHVQLRLVKAPGYFCPREHDLR